MFEISKDFTFDAAHHLHGLREGHKCGRVHGHTYTVRVVLATEGLDEHGFVMDFGDLAPLKEHIDTQFDHRDLNDVLVQPTAEHLAEHIAKVCLGWGWPVWAVGVAETPKTWAWWKWRGTL